MCQKIGILSYTAAKISELANVDTHIEYEQRNNDLLRGTLQEIVRKYQVGI